MPGRAVLPTQAQSHVPGAVLDHLAEVFQFSHVGQGHENPTSDGEQPDTEGPELTGPTGPEDFALPDAAISHMPPPALSHVPDFFGLADATSSWSLPDAALDHMSPTAIGSVPDWFGL